MVEWDGHFVIERAGVIQHGKEKAPGRPHSDLPVLKEGL